MHQRSLQRFPQFMFNLLLFTSIDPYGMFDINEDTGRVRYIGPMYEGMRTVTIVVLVRKYLSPGMRKPTMWILTRSDTNHVVQPLKMARGLKFVFRKKRYCTIQVAKKKALISFAVTTKLICVLVFAYAKRMG